jgi:acetyltransferase-like isoleucine patch superfamily enzyme
LHLSRLKWAGVSKVQNVCGSQSFGKSFQSGHNRQADLPFNTQHGNQHGVSNSMATVSAKQRLSGALGPLLRLAGGFDGELAGRWRQFWAFARLQACVPHLDASCIVTGMPELHGTRRLRFGRELYLYRDLYLETRETGEISIGDGVVISRGVHLVAFAGIEIGAGSMIGEYASLRDANHRFGLGPGDGAGVALRYAGHHAKPIRIGRNVWIGRGVCVLAGVSIGDNAVIGANAVVTRDVPAAAVVAGVPARPLHAQEGI